MKINRIDIITIMVFALLAIYLFVKSPVPLEEANQQVKGEMIPVNTMFEIVAEENNKMRTQWTKQIVGMGKKVGFKFGEDWRKQHVDKGPLPALFLRETASHLEKSSIPLSLFLGSDYPINSANMFNGLQEDAFKKIKQTNESQFFFDEDVKRYTAMFPDKVVVKACASCHNDHPDSPKNDWKMNDIMGATTWSYPKEYVTRDELIEIITLLRNAFEKTYISYLEKTKTFDNPPKIGEQWPSEGYFLPTENAFMNLFKNSASITTLNFLLKKKELSQANLIDKKLDTL
jgi:adenylate cyclase